MLILTCLVAMAFSSSACFIAKVETPGIRKIVSTSPVRGTKVASLDANFTNWYILWGLIPLGGQPDVTAEVDKQVGSAGGKAVANAEITTGHTMPMMLLNILTGFFSVYNKQIMVKGDIVK